MDCENCAYYAYDEDYEENVCTADMDEDDLAKIMSNTTRVCPFYRNGDEYAVVKKQM